MRKLVWSAAFLSIPVALLAHENGFPLGYSGAPTDSKGATCTQCHITPPVNVLGHLTLFVSNYSPGVQQTLSLHIDDDQALDFAFQLTARLSNGAQAGIFTPTPSSLVYCSNGSQGPCADGDVEYITNMGSSPISPGHGQFVISWTPPGVNLGNGAVTFYVAAIAGTGANATASGHAFAATMPISAAPCSLTGTPAFNVLTGVVDAAANRRTIGSLGLFAISGAGFFAPGAPGYSATLTDLTGNGEWPTELGCVSVLLNGTAVPIYFVSEQEIRAQAINFPSPEGADVQVILNPGTVNQITGPVFAAAAAPLAPALFTVNSSGTGNARAFDTTKNAALGNPSVVPGAVSASKGDVIKIFGTGFGATNPLYAPGQFALAPAPLANPVGVTIGDVKIPASDVLYAGLTYDPNRQQNSPGLYEVTIRLPQLPSGEQLVTVAVGHESTQGSVTIPLE